MEILWQIFSGVMGCSTLLGFILYGRANRRIKNAEAMKAEAEADRAEVERLTAQLDHQQKTIENLLDINSNLSGRLSKLNDAVDKHIDRNRELSDRLYKSESALNIANGRITELTAELGDERALRKHFQIWRCERSDCKDPRGPKPPRTALADVPYKDPRDSKK